MMQRIGKELEGAKRRAGKRGGGGRGLAAGLCGTIFNGNKFTVHCTGNPQQEERDLPSLGGLQLTNRWDLLE